MLPYLFELGNALSLVTTVFGFEYVKQIVDILNTIYPKNSRSFTTVSSLKNLVLRLITVLRRTSTNLAGFMSSNGEKLGAPVRRTTCSVYQAPLFRA